jgi:hypothetical protein
MNWVRIKKKKEQEGPCIARNRVQNIYVYTLIRPKRKSQSEKKGEEKDLGACHVLSLLPDISSIHRQRREERRLAGVTQSRTGNR